MNDIASRIIAEAEKEAAQLSGENDQILEKMNREAMEKEEKRERIMDEELKEIYQREVQRHRSRENIEGGKRILSEKTRIIEETLDELKRRLREESELYKEFLSAVMLKGIQTGREEILVSDADRGLLDSRFIADLNSAVEKELEKKGAVFLSEESRNTDGGFFLREGKREFNATVDAVVETVAEKYQLEIIALFFGNERDDYGTEKG